MKVFYIIDEYENLNEDQQRSVNTLIKHCAPVFSVKVGVRDYGFRTREILSEGEFLSHPADFVAIRIFDQFDKSAFQSFARKVVRNRLNGLVPSGDLDGFFDSLNLEEEYDQYCRPKIRQSLEEKWSFFAKDLQRLGKVSLLFKAFCVGYLEHNGVAYAKAGEYISENYESLKVSYGNYSYLIVLNELRTSKSSLKKRFGGETMLADLSGKNIRYFMEIVCRALLEEGKKGEDFSRLSIDSQTKAVIEVGEEYLRDIELRGLTGKAVSRLLLGVGAVFEGLSRSTYVGKPEVTQFIVIQDGSTAQEIVCAETLVEDGVRHGAFLEFPLTKAEGPGVVKDKEFMIFPVFCPFLGFSHRKKRRERLQANEICLLARDPEEGARVVMRRLSRENAGRDDQQFDLFD